MKGIDAEIYGTIRAVSKTYCSAQGRYHMWEDVAQEAAIRWVLSSESMQGIHILVARSYVDLQRAALGRDGRKIWSRVINVCMTDLETDFENEKTSNIEELVDKKMMLERVQKLIEKNLDAVPTETKCLKLWLDDVSPEDIAKELGMKAKRPRTNVGVHVVHARNRLLEELSEADDCDRAFDMLDDAITVGEAERMLGVSTHTLVRWARRNHGPKRVYHRNRAIYRRSEVEQWMATTGWDPNGYHGGTRRRARREEREAV